MERFTTMSFEGFVVKDSLNFMATSLDKMVMSLKSKIDEEHPPEKVFCHVLRYFRSYYPQLQYPQLTDSLLQSLLLQKGVMPYEYITDDDDHIHSKAGVAGVRTSPFLHCVKTEPPTF